MLWKIPNKGKFFPMLIIVLGFAVSLTCDKASVTDPGQPSYDTTIMPIEGNILFYFKETFQSSDKLEHPRITLFVRTEKIYSHGGFEIAADMKSEKNSIEINIHGIKYRNVGTDAFSPAFWKTFLDIPNDTYHLKFEKCWTDSSKTDYLDSLTVLVDAQSIQIQNLTQNFTKPDYKLYWRYPQNSFAYICGTLVQDSCICDVFLDSLKNIIYLEKFDFPNEGVKAYPSSSSGHYNDTPAQYFKYISDEDYAKAGEFLKNYSRDVLINYEGLSISLIGWHNVNYLSWVHE